VGVTTFVAIPAETRGWLQRPQTEDKTYLYNPTASFNSLSNVPVLKGLVTPRSWLT
jgi:hypothetical protein